MKNISSMNLNWDNKDNPGHIITKILNTSGNEKILNVTQGGGGIRPIIYRGTKIKENEYRLLIWNYLRRQLLKCWINEGKKPVLT